jgi:hypothetical protein
MAEDGQHHAPAALDPEKRAGTPLYRSLGEPQSRSGPLFRRCERYCVRSHDALLRVFIYGSLLHIRKLDMILHSPSHTSHIHIKRKT